MPDEFDNLTDVSELLETAEERDENLQDGEVIGSDGTVVTLDK
jgi:hypothetical protein